MNDEISIIYYTTLYQNHFERNCYIFQRQPASWVQVRKYMEATGVIMEEALLASPRLPWPLVFWARKELLLLLYSEEAELGIMEGEESMEVI
jgi:hypothetical protein